jgi:hypothetical protein
MLWSLHTFNPMPTAPIEYAGLDFPFRPESLWAENSRRHRSKADGENLVGWLRSIEPERTPYSEEFFAGAGCDAGQLEESRRAVEEFDRVLHPWIRGLYASRFGVYWTNDFLADGWPTWPTRVNAEHDLEFEALEASVTIDIVLWVLNRVRRSQDVQWVLSEETFGVRHPKTGHEPLSYLPTLAPGDPHLYPVNEVRSLIGGALTRLDSRSSVRLWMRYCSGWTRLGALYDALVGESSTD